MKNKDILHKLKELFLDENVTTDQIRLSGFEKVYIKPLAQVIAESLKVERKQHFIVDSQTFTVQKVGVEWTITIPLKNGRKQEESMIDLSDTINQFKI